MKKKKNQSWTFWIPNYGTFIFFFEVEMQCLIHCFLKKKPHIHLKTTNLKDDASVYDHNDQCKHKNYRTITANEIWNHYTLQNQANKTYNIQKSIHLMNIEIKHNFDWNYKWIITETIYFHQKTEDEHIFKFKRMIAHHISHVFGLQMPIKVLKVILQ